MGVINYDGWNLDFHNPPDLCFYCSSPLSADPDEVWIFWNGASDHQIWMHPYCAKRLADNLNLDWARFKQLYPEKVWKQA